MSWAGRRKGLYITTTTLLILVVFGGGGYLLFRQVPTCADGRHNGTERGVDCGGACQRICKEDAHAPVVLWRRQFLVAPGIYSVAANIENTNKDSFVRSAHYTFKMFDAKNILVAQRDGVTSISPGRNTIVIETGIGTGSRESAKVFFEFTGTLQWEKGALPRVDVDDVNPDFPNRKVTATIVNNTGKEIRDVPISIVVYDESQTAIAASKSLVKRLIKGAKEEVVFTWPVDFSSTPVRVEILPIALP